MSCAVCVRLVSFCVRGEVFVHAAELEVIVSPHRDLVAPLVNYIWTLHQQRPDLTLTVAVPEIMARHWWHRSLHDRIARRLRRTLDALPGVVVISVPFHLAHG